MDASVMNGINLMCGAVAAVQNIKNHVSLARAVMEKSGHVPLTGSGALEFAKKVKAEFSPDDYFFVEMRRERLQQALESDTIILDHTKGDESFGTVGAVVFDAEGNLAAGT